MDALQIEKTIDIISCDKVFTEQILGDGSSIELILYNSSLSDRKRSVLVYEKAYLKAIEIGLLTEEELKMFYIEADLWSVDKEIRIETIRSDIHKITKGLLSLIFYPSKLRMAKAMLRKAEKELRNLIVEKMTLLRHTAEDYALSQKQRYIISKVVHVDDGRFWKSDRDFDNEQDIQLVNRLCSLLFDESRLGIKIIKEVARSNQWKVIWSATKNSGNLFETQPICWTDNQIDLAYWSSVYDMVLEAYERPSKEIIDDDDLLDSWFINQHDKIEEKAKGSKMDALKTNKNGKQEIFVFSDREGAKEVYGLNDSITRSKIKAKQKTISLKGRIAEQDLPESQTEMREQMVNKLRNQMGNISKGK
jgi:hypothetical protein